MSLFKHVFGKKQQPKAPAEPEPIAEQISDQENVEKESFPWRTFSIFISSTFADMQAERDHLKNVVFPEIEEELQQRRIKLEIVDLRWGVETNSMEQEDEREANVLKVCIDEIKRCRPFFIGLLGDRYGWVPPEKRMTEAVIGQGLEIPLQGKSVTDLEIEFGVLAGREQLSRSAFYFREPLPYEELTPQRAALFSDQHNPELSEKDKAERKSALEKLKVKIREHFEKENRPGKVKTYTASWDAENKKVTGLKDFGEMVKKDILAECESHANETWDAVPKDWQEQEMALLDSFINHHTHITTFITEKGEEHIPTFCGREPLLKELRKHLLSEEGERWGLVLTGESGSGKSAVFSMVHRMMEKEDCLILAHSAGLSPRAKHVADLLKIWNNLLRKELTSPLHPSPEGEGAGGEAIEELQQQFAELLSMAATHLRVVLLIDALDRFEPTGRAKAMSWLPMLMPRNTRLLVTAITGTEKEAVKYHKALQLKSIDIFTLQEAEEMLNSLSRRYHKTLPAGISKLILGKERPDGMPAASSPLWLSLAVNILMAIDQDDFEQMSKLEGRGDQQIESYLATLAQGFDPMPGKLFLSLIAKAGLVFGREFTQAVFDYIAISRNGLREKDLESLLPARGIEWDPLRFAMVRRWFKSHMVIQGEELQWNLVHSILDNALQGKLTEEESKEKHQAVAGYLLTLHDSDALKISETMYHLMQADDRELAGGYYSSYWWNTLQTEGSSKALAEAIILDEAQQKSGSLEWVISIAEAVSGDNDRIRNLLNNMVFSLFDKHLQGDTTVTTRIRLMATVEVQIEELCRRVPNSADYERDLAISYSKLGDLFLELGSPSKSLDKYRAALFIREGLHRRTSLSAIYARDLSISYSKLGDLYLQLGDPPKALEIYMAALDIAEELRLRAPDSADYARDLSVSYDKLGDLYLQLGDPTKAMDKYQANINIAEELCRRAPDSAIYSRDLSVSNDKLGDLFLQLGDPPKALEKYQASLNIREKLRRLAPNSADYTRDIAISYSKLGDLFLQLGDISKALDKYQSALVIREELRRRTSDSAVYARDLSVSYDKLGDLYFQLCDFSKSLERYQASLDIREELHRRAPDSAVYTRDLSVSYDKLGDLYFQLCDFSKSLDKYHAALYIAEELSRRAPDSAVYARDLAISYSKLGNLYLKLGESSKALDKYQAAIDIAEELRRRAPDSADYIHDLSLFNRQLGDSYLKLGESLKAKEKYQKSKELFSNGINSTKGKRFNLIKGQRFNLEKGNNKSQNEDIIENRKDVLNQSRQTSLDVSDIEDTTIELRNHERNDFEKSGTGINKNISEVNQTAICDPIRFSAFGPKSAKPSDLLIIDIWAYTSTQYNEVIKRVSNTRKKVEHGTVGPISVLFGTRFFIYLYSNNFEIHTGVQPLMWQGEPANVSFSISVPKGLRMGYYPCSAIILQEKIPVVTLSFELLVNNRTNKPEFLGHDKYIKSLFASYAAEDRNKVILWTEGARSVGTSVFLDVLSLRQGQNWEMELWEQIPKNDVFILFWSLSASKSKWVEKEWRCALQTKGIESIYPVPFADPRDVPPPQELASVKHFNDLSFMIYEYEKGRL